VFAARCERCIQVDCSDHNNGNGCIATFVSSSSPRTERLTRASLRAFRVLRTVDFSEDLIRDLGACRDHRSQFPPVDNSVVRVEACPTTRAISSMLTPRWLIRLTNEVRSSRAVQSSPIPPQCRPV
jgi:hypothetical protein